VGAGSSKRLGGLNEKSATHVSLEVEVFHLGFYVEYIPVVTRTGNRNQAASGGKKKEKKEKRSRSIPSFTLQTFSFIKTIETSRHSSRIIRIISDMKLALAFTAFAVFLSQAEAFAPISSRSISTSSISTSTWNNVRVQTSLNVAQDVEVNSGPISSNLPRKRTKEVSYL
jgi:hypothetical protein